LNNERKRLLRKVLTERISELRALPYRDLAKLVGNRDKTKLGLGGVVVFVEVFGLWEDEQAGDVRIVVNVDDGKWRAFVPLSDSFIVRAPDPGSATSRTVQ